MRLLHPTDRQILRLAVPALGALVAEPLYVLADTAVVGHLGTEPLAGLAVASAALLAGYALFIFLAFGTTGAVARLLGAGREDEAAHQAVQSLWLALAIAAVLVPVAWIGAPGLLGVMGATGGVREQGLIYLRISLLGVPSLLLTLAGTGYLRGLQDTRTPLYVALAANAVNLGLELVLIPGLGFGIGASALSTVVAQTGAAAVYVVRVVRAARARGVGARPDRTAIRTLAAVGRDLLVRTAALRLALLLTTALATRIGTVDVAAHEIAFALWNFVGLGLDSVAIAGQSMIGLLLGAGDTDGARAAGRRMVGMSVVLGAVAAVVIAALQPVLPDLFTDDAEVLRLAAFLLWFVAALQPVNAVAFVLDGILIGAGDLRFLAWAMVADVAVFAVAAGLVLVTGAGIGWLWAALGLLMAARALTLGVRFVGGSWAVPGAPGRVSSVSPL